MEFKNIDELSLGLVNAFIHKNKKKILLMLEKRDKSFVKEKMSISDIQRELGISYKETHRHVKELVNAGLLKREHSLKEKHQRVYISLKIKFPPK